MQRAVAKKVQFNIYYFLDLENAVEMTVRHSPSKTDNGEKSVDPDLFLLNVKTVL